MAQGNYTISVNVPIRPLQYDRETGILTGKVIDQKQEIVCSVFKGSEAEVKSLEKLIIDQEAYVAKQKTVKIAMTPVKSSNLESIGWTEVAVDKPEGLSEQESRDWDSTTTSKGVMEVRFKGGRGYRYFSVPKNIWERMQGIVNSGSSLGTWFNENVRFKFEYLAV